MIDRQNTTHYKDCEIIDAEVWNWYYFFAGMSWWLMGYYCMKCGDSLKRVRERIEQQEEIITAEAVIN